MLVNEMLGMLYRAGNQEEALTDILALAGKSFDVSRVYVFELDEGGRSYRNSYEWCGEGVEPQKDRLARIPREYAAEWECIFKSSGILRLPDVNRLDSMTSGLLASYNIKSILIAPLYYKASYTGFFGFDECRAKRLWTDDEEQVLRDMASIISTEISVIKKEKERDAMLSTLEYMLNSLNSAVYVSDLDTNEILFTNKKFEDIHHSLINTACLTKEGLNTSGPCRLEDILYEGCGDINEGCVRIVRHEDTGRWYEVLLKVIRWTDGRLAHFGNFFEITNIKKAEEQMSLLASLDHMTGVFNRNVGLAKMAAALEECKRSQTAFAIGYVDLDNLKHVNDTYGHSEGDYMIKTLANALKRVTRDTDMICRLGGDEFLLALVGCSQGEINTVLSRVEKQLEMQSKGDNKPYSIRISYGTQTLDHLREISIQEMIQISDQRMYKHKSSKSGSKRRSDHAAYDVTKTSALMSELHRMGHKQL